MNNLLNKIASTRHVCAVASYRSAGFLQWPILGGFSWNCEKQYRSMPTHGIGRYKYLLPKDAPKKKKDKHQMKQIKAATNTEYGVLNILVSGYDMTQVELFSKYIHKLCNRFRICIEENYALPTKSTEVMVMPEQGTKMYLDAVLRTHERIVQISRLNATFCPIFMEIILKNQPEGVQLSIKEHTEADYHARFKARPELEGLLAQMS
ncbi:large ribosomal subunit protein mL48 [Denticeps clupeoides]|uniref:Large ribosomal subunit protein mL48 n=2 Tax=Denticeps clupeoides TaxID=299321 RepID=A0AAY4A319_9TELE|nr:39S ribosomal protein L48, mitochondrial-like [Denticeps clupeoides]XP_028840152.1 39S ribosomal protein L48, mitochondrial-like [Denticeps clupeoides]